MNNRTMYVAGAAAVALAVGLAVFLPGRDANTSLGALAVGQVQTFEVSQRFTPSPPTPFTSPTGQVVTMADFQDQVVMLNFWASWCAPCLRELPSIDRLQAEMGGDDFTVVAINIDREGEPVARQFFDRLGIETLDLFLDPENRTSRDMVVTVMPTTIIFDRQGREVGRLNGPAEWDSDEAKALLQHFIDTPDFADQG